MKSSGEEQVGKAVLTVPRTLGFVVTAVLLGLSLSSLAVDEERAVALTAAQVAKDLYADIADQVRATTGASEGGPIAFELVTNAGAETREELMRAAHRLGYSVGSEPGLTRVQIDVAKAGDFVELTATVGAGGEPLAGRRRVGDWRSIVPPLFAILVALFFRQLIVAMLGAVLLGAVLHFESNVAVNLALGAQRYLWGNVTDSFNLQILAFTVALVGMILVSTRAGGSQGLIDVVSRVADSVRSTRIATALMGLVIFFDDYANAIVVGTTVRPMSDKRRISREKLAYLVDSTAAPVAGLAVISTWIAYELGLLQPLIDQLGIELEAGQSTNAYSMFLMMLPLRFYCLFTLIFVFTNAYMGRDYGPMLAAERRAFATGQVLAPGARPLTSRAMSEIQAEPGIPCRWYNAMIPIGVVVLTVVIGMLWSGKAEVEAKGLVFDVGDFETWKLAFGAADSGFVLLVSAIVGSVVAIGLAVGQRLLSPFQAAHAWFQAIPAMALAFGILICAWAIRSVCDDLGTNVFLISAMGDTIPPLYFPLFTFLLAAAVAFATGTSWGTMGILLPVAVPWVFAMTEGTDAGVVVVLLTAAAVLDGAIMGDHCSPISDTTVLSSIATSCDHVDHVRTQLPYALTGMALAALAYVGASAGAPAWSLYVGALVAIVLIMRFIGKPHAVSTVPAA